MASHSSKVGELNHFPLVTFKQRLFFLYLSIHNIFFLKVKHFPIKLLFTFKLKMYASFFSIQHNLLVMKFKIENV